MRVDGRLFLQNSNLSKSELLLCTKLAKDPDQSSNSSTSQFPATQCYATYLTALWQVRMFLLQHTHTFNFIEHSNCLNLSPLINSNLF